MKKIIITISREFGCGAREIARKLASDLGITFYDKDLVDMAAQKAGVHVDVFKNSDEVIMARSASKLFREFGYGSSTAFYSEQAIAAQADVIRDIADGKDAAILFGRCSDYILRDRKDVLNVFIHADFEYRKNRVVSVYGQNEFAPDKRIKDKDKRRIAYYKYYTDRKWADAKNYQLCLDSGVLGIDKCVELIEKAM